MRSYLTKPFSLEEEFKKLDLSSIPSGQEIREAARWRLAKGYITLADLSEDEALQKGDSVQLRVESSMPRFNKERVTVDLGSGLYDKALEAGVVGRHVGDSGSVATRGAEVKYTVLSARRKSVPEPTDEMAEAQGWEGVHTVAEFTKRLGDDLQSMAITGLLDRFQEHLADMAEIHVAPEDLTAMEGAYRNFWHRQLRSFLGLKDTDPLEDSHGLPEWLKNHDVESLGDLIRNSCADNERKLRVVLAACHALGRDPEAEYDPGTDAAIFINKIQVVCDLRTKLEKTIQETITRRN